ncbi:peptidoglycan DD-metalloendopeptidase family protein [Crenobacter sp. SG2303]|uniref:Peptidoglycan DD-metalloendopeptidase family protein n=1 Tax=Crenobacter oryzisoli TaxID=3056844 RepID=A0ABT7XI66_9NEIS|nr:peptidoglycan DD-metalloendopeptidase family protein [Crenobacter sp. SG2303]MDN0073492.1 peptidoglycan DD-metalloendopeptidase family protein [Crenobacter sp. SG2303]
MASLPLFGMVTAYAITADEAETAAVKVQQVTETLALALPPLTESSSNTRYWREEPIRRGDTIAALLHRLGINDGDANGFLASNSKARDLLKLKPGQTVSVKTNDDGKLFAMQFLNDDDNGEKQLVAIEKANDGKWQTSADPVDTQMVPTVRSVTVRNNVASALTQAEVPAEVLAQLSDIFADKLDVAKLRAGDRLQLVYETYLYQGAPITTGNVLAAEIDSQGKHYGAFYFAQGDDSGAYYDENGHPFKQGFSRQPVANARVSSPFGLRYHPILHALRLHAGIDFAAAIGTPIIAPADGVVMSAQRENGYGNVVTLRHNAKMTTLYAHMSRFAAGLKAGEAVKAGDVIGYIGTTGRSTGPHLHFEVRVNGQAVDPATSALPTRTLTQSEQLAFRQQSVKLAQDLKLLRAIPTTVAQFD